MGYYLQAPKYYEKADYLLEKFGGLKLSEAPIAFADVPSDKALVCVVDNGPFEAAAVAYSEQELAYFAHPDDERPKEWLLLNDREKVYEAAKLKPEYLKG